MKTKTVLEIEKENRSYHFICENTSPLGEVYDVLFEMRQDILQRMQKVNEEEQKASRPVPNETSVPQKKRKK